ncbi:site-specific DNA-methyltransferase [Pontibacter sp. G13]|uniref:site-specific DNA-methyltransferase n=1 Tax=Pontibacter sp. G13 TaxID=3074898 RepID=UPI00288C5139|nr:site-specific DNA-methyltransferase [Pontibacter sp. G13]WNJ21317.1 site-specific DNA-methyltransferase [Pontibacter sp. G13]
MNVPGSQPSCTLLYPGKQSIETILGKPARAFDWENPFEQNLLFFGDNLPILRAMQPQWHDKIDLIYIDPPFGTGQRFEDRSKQLAYEDPIADHEYWEFIRERVVLLRELLSECGSLYLHIDKKAGHYLKVILDEVFGPENFINDLTRIKCNPKNFSRKAFGNYSDMILYYAKNRDQQIWNPIREPLASADIERLYPRTDPQRGPYTTHPLHAPGETRNGDTGQPWRGMTPPKGRHWRYKRAKLEELEQQNMIEWSSTGNPRKRSFASEHPGKKIQDVWTFKDKGIAYTQYPTEKNHDLLERIIAHSSTPDSWVLDAFAGSGGTLATAEKMGRKWVGMDCSPFAIEVAQNQLSRISATYRYEIHQES